MAINNLPPFYQPTVFNQQIFSCRLATTANLVGTLAPANSNNGVGTTLTNATTLAALSIDSTAVSVGDRVLLVAQTAAAQNGVYVVKNAGSSTDAWVLTRAPDWCQIEQMIPGGYCPIEDGSTLKGSIYVFVRPIPGAVNVNNISFILS
jgi:hypothetical protein